MPGLQWHGPVRSLRPIPVLTRLYEFVVITKDRPLGPLRLNALKNDESNCHVEQGSVAWRLDKA